MRHAALLALTLCLAAGAEDALRFDVTDTSAQPLADAGVLVAPWRVIELDPDYGGQWAVAADLDGDGAPEIVSAENHNEGDVHYTSAVAAQRLDGEALWRWGDPDAGRKHWHHDVACQALDWDGDGHPEVVVATQGFVVTLDGMTGAEKARFPIPDEATDCLVFCDLSGAGRATDVLVKNRYEQVWAYGSDGALLWTVRLPGGYRTAHQPRPMDLDGDGRDEILAGYALLNPDGTVRWTLPEDPGGGIVGHLDCARLLRTGDTPADARIAMTFCGGNRIALVDGAGRYVWKRDGHHFESLQFARMLPGVPGEQILVDIDHMPPDQSPLWVLDADGVQHGRILTRYSRHHRLVDWDGDGLAEIAVGGNLALYNHEGRRIATLDVPERYLDEEVETSILPADMTGDGVADLLVITPGAVCVFRNERGLRPDPPHPLGTAPNVTLY